MYDDDVLMEKRETHLRENRPKEYSRLRKSGELQAHLQERAKACRSTAVGLIDAGTTHEGQAWQWAIRSEILDTPWD